MKTYRILGCGDVHIEFKLVKQVLLIADKKEVDLIIFTGDFCDGRKLPDDASVADFLSQIKPMIKLLQSNKIPKFLVLGNHDPIELGILIREDTSVVDLHNSTIKWNNYLFGGIGGSHYVTPQLFNRTVPFSEGLFPEKIENENFEFVKKIQMDDFHFYIHNNVQLLYERAFPCDIFVSHTPPLLRETDHYSNHSAGIGYLLAKYKPLLALSGHVHKPEIMTEVFEWSDGKSTHLTNFGSLDQRKVFLIGLKESTKQIVDIEILDL